jgi:energy-coupling factor transporter ATP-binding protein EcfA2
MAERLTKIVMSAFRATPARMTVELARGQSFIVLGENGTGKSSIADALEWYFTGRISYLTHEGRGEAVRNLAAKDGLDTSVEITTDGSLGGRAALPNGPPVHPRRIGERETFLLRGRTLAEFIDRTKGEKWKALTEILGLDSVDRLRLDLQRARNDLRRAARDARDAVKQRAEPLAARLKVGMQSLSSDKVLDGLSGRCKDAGLEPPDTFDSVVDPGWSTAASPGPGAALAVQASSLASELQAGGPLPSSAEALEIWNGFIGEQPHSDSALVRLLRAADEIMRNRAPEGLCPLCRQPIEDERLRLLVTESLQELRAAAGRLEEAEGAIRGLAESLHDSDRWRRQRRERALAVGVTLTDVPPSPAPSVAAAKEAHEAVESGPLTSYAREVADWDRQAAEAVAAFIPSAPSAKDEALWDVAVMAQQARDWHAALTKAEKVQRAAEQANQVFVRYQDKQGRYFKEVLDRISGRAAEIYGALHPGEGLGAVSVELWGEKGVELAVDFHGKKAKPPHGVLSESHLNSLAIALFLAMAGTFNERLGFLVLDDVVNSFDIEHRGQLAELLAMNFDSSQLIVLTHDPIFFERVTKLAPSWENLQLTSWSYEEGPRTTEYETPGVLAIARRDLAENQTMGAGQKGRRALEELLQEICEGLQAPVPFRRGAKNDRREVIELMKGVRRCLADNAKQLLKELEPLLRLLEADVASALNVEAHASLGTAAGAEIKAALDRIAQLDGLWTCPGCRTRVWLRGTPEASRCRCAKRTFPPPAGSWDRAPDESADLSI